MILFMVKDLKIFVKMSQIFKINNYFNKINVYFEKSFFILKNSIYFIKIDFELNNQAPPAWYRVQGTTCQQGQVFLRERIHVFGVT